MKTPDITLFSLILCLLLLSIPLIFSFIFKLKKVQSILFSVIRMTIQLILIGLFLKYLFQLNNIFLNILWLIFMIFVATFTVIKKNSLKLQIFALPTFLSISIATFFVLLYFNSLILRIDNIFDARFLVVIGGMLLGNSLRANIIGVGSFYRSLKRNENRYIYRLSLGATLFEAIMPYLRYGINSSIEPTLASMATMGIVALPGMMTGQILGGVTPVLAVKYQISIMIAIFVSTTISVVLTILLTLKTSFNSYGVLKKEIFKSLN